MENASKALLMAGGVLIAIIIASVFVYMYNEARRLPQTQEQIKEAEELAAFNKKYEVYNKTGLRGTDVMTVMYMADDNNDSRKYENERDYWITVEFYVSNEIDGTIRKYKLANNRWVLDSTYGKKNKASTSINGWYINRTNGISQKATNTLPDDVYKSATDKNQAKAETKYLSGKESSPETNTDWKPNFSEIEKDVMDMADPSYYAKNNAARELMRTKFDCTKIEYSSVTGRVTYMRFEQQ